MPRVSICLPNLNTRKYLPELLESIKAQTFKDWELVVFDDYSDDGSWELFQTWAQRESRMKISQAPKKGMYPGWNNCLRETQGEWIYVATSDDTMYPQCLQVALSHAERHPESRLLMFEIDLIDSQSRVLEHWHRSRHRPPRCTYGRLLNTRAVIPGIREFVAQALAVGVYQSITGVFFHREVLEAVGEFSSQFASAGDTAWVMKATSRFPVHWIPEILATWRLHGSQGSRRKNLVGRDEAVDFAISEALSAGKISEDLFQRICEIRMRSREINSPRLVVEAIRADGTSRLHPRNWKKNLSDIGILARAACGENVVLSERASLVRSVWETLEDDW